MQPASFCAGLAVSMFLTALTQGISILTNTGQSLTFWSAGRTAGIRMDQLKIAAPVLIAALIAALLLSRQVSLLSHWRRSSPLARSESQSLPAADDSWSSCFWRVRVLRLLARSPLSVFSFPISSAALRAAGMKPFFPAP